MQAHTKFQKEQIPLSDEFSHVTCRLAFLYLFQRSIDGYPFMYKASLDFVGLERCSAVVLSDNSDIAIGTLMLTRLVAVFLPYCQNIAKTFQWDAIIPVKIVPLRVLMVIYSDRQSYNRDLLLPPFQRPE